MSSFVDPRSRPTWSLVRDFFAGAGRSLEVGCGYLLTLPPEAYFFDVNAGAADHALAMGGKASVASASELPYPTGAFGLVVAFDVIEHVENGDAALAEIWRVLKDNGVFIFSVPLFMKYWSTFDVLAGHWRRYDPADLEAALVSVGFEVVEFCCPRNLSDRLFQNKFLRQPLIWLRRLLKFASERTPSLVGWLYRLYDCSPIHPANGFSRACWRDGRLSEIRNQCEVYVIARKISCS